MTEPAAPTRYATFAEFWPFYLREHSRPRTRALHYVGTSLVVAVAAFALVTGRYWCLRRADRPVPLSSATAPALPLGPCLP